MKKYQKIIIIVLIIALLLTTITIIIHNNNEKTKQQVLKNIQQVIPNKLLPQNYTIDTSKEYNSTKDQIKYTIKEDTIQKESKTLYTVEVLYPQKCIKENINDTSCVSSTYKDTFYITINKKTKEIEKITLKDKYIIYQK